MMTILKDKANSDNRYWQKYIRTMNKTAQALIFNEDTHHSLNLSIFLWLCRSRGGSVGV